MDTCPRTIYGRDGDDGDDKDDDNDAAARRANLVAELDNRSLSIDARHRVLSRVLTR